MRTAPCHCISYMRERERERHRQTDRQTDMSFSGSPCFLFYITDTGFIVNRLLKKDFFFFCVSFLNKCKCGPQNS